MPNIRRTGFLQILDPAKKKAKRYFFKLEKGFMYYYVKPKVRLPLTPFIRWITTLTIASRVTV